MLLAMFPEGREELEANAIPLRKWRAWIPSCLILRILVYRLGGGVIGIWMREQLRTPLALGVDEQQPLQYCVGATDTEVNAVAKLAA